MNRRRHRDSWWTEETGGMTHWVLVALTAMVAVGAAWVVLSIPQRVEANPDRTPRPIPTFTQPTADEDIAPPTVLFIGDSYTQGLGASSQGDRWSSLVATDQGWAETNLGRGGTGYVTTSSVCGFDVCPTFTEMLALDAADASADYVVIAGGQNDLAVYNSDRVATDDAIHETYARYRAAFPDAALIAVGPSLPGGEVNDALRQIDATVQMAADENDAIYVSLIDPPVLSPDMTIADGIHVDGNGHAAIATRVLSALP